jgi:hypothetical protein
MLLWTQESSSKDFKRIKYEKKRQESVFGTACRHIYREKQEEKRRKRPKTRVKRSK